MAPSRIAERIRELIVRGTLSPGVHLGQAELADEFEAGPAPVREALKLLAAEGVVSHDPNRGFFVAAVSGDEARQLYRLRHLMEMELLSTVEWPDAAQIEKFTVQIDELEQLLAAGESTLWAARHRDFYVSVFDLSSEKMLVRELLKLCILTDRYRSLLPAPLSAAGETGVEDERRILNALAGRDRARLLAVFRQGHSRAESILLDLLCARDL